MECKYRNIRLLFLLSLVFMPAMLKAQKTDVYYRMFPSSWYNSFFEPAIDGSGIGVAFHPALSKVSSLNISAEFAVLRTRNEVLLGLGYNHSIIELKKFRISAEANVLGGMDLYKPKPLYLFGGEAAARVDYPLGKKLGVFASVGARLTWCPGYQNYGVWKYNYWPVTLGIRF